MLRIMEGDIDRETVIRFRCKSRDIAWSELALFKKGLVPPGHVVDVEHVTANRSDENPRPGRKVDVTIVLFHNDSRQLAIDYGNLERTLKVLDTV